MSVCGKHGSRVVNSRLSEQILSGRVRYQLCPSVKVLFGKYHWLREPVLVISLFVGLEGPGMPAVTWPWAFLFCGSVSFSHQMAPCSAYDHPVTERLVSAQMNGLAGVKFSSGLWPCLKNQPPSLRVINPVPPHQE